MVNYEKNICKAIEVITERAIHKANHCSCIIATIVDCINPLVGKYIIKYQNANFMAYSDNFTTIYPKDASVYILLPNGQIDEEMIILGLNHSQPSVKMNNLKEQSVLSIEQKNNYLYPKIILNNIEVIPNEMRKFKYRWENQEGEYLGNNYLLSMENLDLSYVKCIITAYDYTFEIEYIKQI